MHVGSAHEAKRAERSETCVRNVNKSLIFPIEKYLFRVMVYENLDQYNKVTHLDFLCWMVHDCRIFYRFLRQSRFAISGKKKPMNIMLIVFFLLKDEIRRVICEMKP